MLMSNEMRQQHLGSLNQKSDDVCHEIKSKDMPKFTEDPPVRIMAAVAVQETDGNIDLL